jgi:hypothetical protein
MHGDASEAQKNIRCNGRAQFLRRVPAKSPIVPEANLIPAKIRVYSRIEEKRENWLSLEQSQNLGRSGQPQA